MLVFYADFGAFDKAEHLYFVSVLIFFAHGYSGLRPASARAAHRRRSLFAPGLHDHLKGVLLYKAARKTAWH